MPEQANLCRRIKHDRRQQIWRSFFYSFFKTRRRGERRQSAIESPAYVDVHGPYAFLAAMLIMLFCVLDALFTMKLIGHGSSELNPFMAVMLNKGAEWFYVSKYVLTALSVIALISHKNFSFLGITGRQFLLFAVVCYACLIGYQLSMLVHLP